jgi:hypothetical protein
MEMLGNVNQEFLKWRGVIKHWRVCRNTYVIFSVTYTGTKGRRKSSHCCPTLPLPKMLWHVYTCIAVTYWPVLWGDSPPSRRYTFGRWSLQRIPLYSTGQSRLCQALTANEMYHGQRSLHFNKSPCTSKSIQCTHRAYVERERAECEQCVE